MVNRNYTAVLILVRLTFAHQNSNKETSLYPKLHLNAYLILLHYLVHLLKMSPSGGMETFQDHCVVPQLQKKMLYLGGWFRFQCSSNSFMIILFVQKYIDRNCYFHWKRSRKISKILDILKS